MTANVTDESIRILLEGTCRDPLQRIRETAGTWDLGGIHINKRFATFSDGFGRKLYPQSHYYKRWFDLTAVGKRGWAVIFQVRPPAEATPDQTAEYLAGWVPPDRADEADRWIEFLNAEIRDRLRAVVATT